MNLPILQQLQDPLTLVLLLLVVGVGVAFIVLMLRAVSGARKELNDVEAHAYESYPNSRLSSQLRRCFVRRLPDDRLLLRAAPSVTIDTWLDREVLQSWRFESGSWITGIALCATFFLIALVLTDHVGPAITAMSGAQLTGKAAVAPGGDMRELSGAVTAMGAKFIVSMAGILLSVVHAFFRSRSVERLHEEAASAAEKLAVRFVLPSDLQVELAECTVQEVQKLQSIEVSVKDIGSELSTSLQHTVKEDIVKGIRRDLEEVVDSLREALTASFAETLKQQLATVTEQLRKIENAVAAQARGQVGELLHKLSDAVSGGFATESSRMKEALERFAEVVPQLEQQMRAMIQSAHADVASRGQENARASQALVQQLERVLNAIESQQRSAIASAESMATLVEKTEQTLANSLQTANEQILAGSQITLDKLTGAVAQSTGEAAQVYRSLVQEVEAAAKLLGGARTETLDGAQSLKEGARQVREVLRVMTDGLAAFKSASEPLARTVDNARAVAAEGSSALRASVEAVQQQQRFLEALAKEWPRLTAQHRDAFEKASSSIATAWDAQARSIEGAVSNISKGFNSSASEFATAVDELGQQIEVLQKSLNSHGSSRPRAS